MAGTAALPSLSSSIYRPNSLGIPNSSFSTSKPSLPFFCFPIRRNGVSVSCQFLTTNRRNFHGINISTTRIRSAVEEETLVPEKEEEASPVSSEQPVSVPVSPSDMLTMFFQAEGTMNESDVPKVINALEQVEGVSDLQVRIVEGVATVELTKQTTVQATGVASSLVEVIQGSGFKLQALNLSFKDEEDNIE